MEAAIRISNVALVALFWFVVTAVGRDEEVRNFILLTSISSVLTVLIIGPINQVFYRYLNKLKSSNSHIILCIFIIVFFSCSLILGVRTIYQEFLDGICALYIIMFVFTANIHVLTSSINLVKKQYKTYIGRLLVWYSLLSFSYFDLTIGHSAPRLSFLLFLLYAVSSVINVYTLGDAIQVRHYAHYRRLGRYAASFFVIGIGTLPVSGLDRLILSTQLNDGQLIQYFFIYQFLIAPGIEFGNSFAGWIVNKVRRIETGLEQRLPLSKYASMMQRIALLLMCLAIPYFLILLTQHQKGRDLLQFEPVLVSLSLICAILAFGGILAGSILTAYGLMRKRLIHKLFIPWLYLILIFNYGNSILNIIIFLSSVLILDLVWTYFEISYFKKRLRLLG